MPRQAADDDVPEPFRNLFQERLDSLGRVAAQPELTREPALTGRGVPISHLFREGASRRSGLRRESLQQLEHPRAVQGAHEEREPLGEAEAARAVGASGQRFW